MNSLTSSISKMMQRPQPPPVPTKSDTAGQSESTQIVVDSDGGSPLEGDFASMQPSTSYASRVPPQTQNHAQSRTTGPGDGMASEISAGGSTGPTLLRRPTLLRGNSGPDAPEGSSAGAGQARPTARAMGPSGGVGVTSAQGQALGMRGIDDGVDAMGVPLPKAKVSLVLFAYRYSHTYRDHLAL